MSHGFPPQFVLMFHVDLRAEMLLRRTPTLSDVCKHILLLVVLSQSLSLSLQLCLPGLSQCLLACRLPWSTSRFERRTLTHSFPSETLHLSGTPSDMALYLFVVTYLALPG